ncbi:MAG: nucleotidyltransferase family protein [Methanospirillum sp.]
MIDADGRIAELEALHTRFPLAGSPPNGLLSADPALLEYLFSVLREDPAPPPARSAEEWQACLSLLDGHSARPILAFLLLKQPAPFRPPAGVVDRLRRELFRSAATAMREDRVLATLLELLRDRGIAPLLLKGAALSRSVYPDAAMRQGSDIDLLVREDELEACAEVIVGMGYRAPYDFHAFSPFTTPHQVYLPPARAPAARPLELHWGLGQGFAQDHDRLEGLFSRSISVPYPAFEFRTLGHADHLAFCAHHALYHHGNAVRLVWICDLAYLSRVLTRTDWQALPGRAVAHRARFATETGLRMASAWTGLPRAGQARSVRRLARARAYRGLRLGQRGMAGVAHARGTEDATALHSLTPGKGALSARDHGSARGEGPVRLPRDAASAEPSRSRRSPSPPVALASEEIVRMRVRTPAVRRRSRAGVSAGPGLHPAGNPRSRNLTLHERNAADRVRAPAEPFHR